MEPSFDSPSSGSPSSKHALSTRQLDLWEHAVLLFRNLEWQAAVESFRTLMEAIDNPKEAQRCIVNEGLIRARLGDIVDARDLFELAVSLCKGSFAAYCALAEAEVILGNSIKAQACYESCLGYLRGYAAAEERSRLGCELDVDMITSNISFLSQQAEGQFANDPRAMGLDRLPADCIFEAPPRSSSTTVSTSAAPGGHRVCGPENVSTTCRLTDSNHVNGQGIDATPDQMKRQADSVLLHPSVSHAIDDQQDQLTTQRDHSISRPLGPAHPNLGGSKRSIRLTARNARVEYESLTDLARFLRHSGPGVSRRYLLDRAYLLRLLDRDSRAASLR